MIDNKEYEQKIIVFKTISYKDNVFAEKEELDDLFNIHYKDSSIINRLQRMKLRVMPKILEYKEKRKEEIKKIMN